MPGRKHKPKDQLLSKPVKLKNDPVLMNMATSIPAPPDEPEAGAEANPRKLS